MQFGFYINPQTPGPDDDGRIINEVLGQTDLAETLGFENVWITDHQFTGYNAYSDPLTLAAAISQRNRSMHIGFSVAVVPLMHPIKFVTQCNVVDQLSEGKLLVGIGAGNSPDEFAGFGLDVNVRHEMMQEFLDVADKAWEAPEGGFSYEGKYYNGTIRGRIIPAPYQRQKPHVVYATATPETLERIGKRGWSLLVGPQPPEVIGKRLHFYLNGLENSGLDEASRQKAWKYSGFLKQVYVAAPGENWEDTLRPYMEIYARKSALANTGIDDLPKDDLEERVKRYAANWLIAGQADEVIERLKPFAQLGFGHMMCWFTFGHMPDEMVRASMLRFAALVAPALREIQPDAELQKQIVAASAAPMKATFLEPNVP